MSAHYWRMARGPRLAAGVCSQTWGGSLEEMEGKPEQNWECVRWSLPSWSLQVQDHSDGREQGSIILGFFSHKYAYNMQQERGNAYIHVYLFFFLIKNMVALRVCSPPTPNWLRCQDTQLILHVCLCVRVPQGTSCTMLHTVSSFIVYDSKTAPPVYVYAPLPPDQNKLMLIRCPHTNTHIWEQSLLPGFRRWGWTTAVTNPYPLKLSKEIGIECKLSKTYATVFVL